MTPATFFSFPKGLVWHERPSPAAREVTRLLEKLPPIIAPQWSEWIVKDFERIAKIPMPAILAGARRFAYGGLPARAALLDLSPAERRTAYYRETKVFSLGRFLFEVTPDEDGRMDQRFGMPLVVLGSPRQYRPWVIKPGRKPTVYGQFDGYFGVVGAVNAVDELDYMANHCRRRPLWQL